MPSGNKSKRRGELNKNIFPGLGDFKVGPTHCLPIIQSLYSPTENILLTTVSSANMSPSIGAI